MSSFKIIEDIAFRIMEDKMLSMFKLSFISNETDIAIEETTLTNLQDGKLHKEVRKLDINNPSHGAAISKYVVKHNKSFVLCFGNIVLETKEAMQYTLPVYHRIFEWGDGIEYFVPDLTKKIGKYSKELSGIYNSSALALTYHSLGKTFRDAIDTIIFRCYYLRDKGGIRVNNKEIPDLIELSKYAPISILLCKFNGDWGAYRSYLRPKLDGGLIEVTTIDSLKSIYIKFNDREIEVYDFYKGLHSGKYVDTDNYESTILDRDISAMILKTMRKFNARYI